MKSRRHAWPWWTLAGIVAVWLLWMTLRPNSAVANDLAPLTRAGAARGLSPYVLISLAGNVAVFIPLGFTLALALRGSLWRRLLLATLIGSAFSLAIELVQTAIASRVVALDDWVLNTVGVALGALTGYGVSRVWK